MKKKELCAKAGISPSSLTKMGNSGHVTTEVLAKICTALGCTVDDIMEVIPDREEDIGSTAKDTV
jgi:DNA-binding Xre family transcriptional regulator